MQPQPTRGLACLLTISESNAVQKQRRFAIALHNPIDAIHHLGIKVDHRRAQDAPKNIDAVEIDGGSAMLAGLLHFARAKRLAHSRLPQQIVSLWRVGIEGEDVIAHGCDEHHIVGLAVGHREVWHIQRLRFDPGIIVDDQTLGSLQALARNELGSEQSLREIGADAAIVI